MARSREFAFESGGCTLFIVPMEIALGIIIVVFSIILHEVAHGFMADALGDPTARYAGRLTLNPLPHIDPVGSVIIPGLLALTHSPFLIGWAKPVPYNPYNLRNQRWGEALVAIAGPLTNIVLAILLGLLIRFAGAIALPQGILAAVAYGCILNIVLALYNLIPLPPLDGSKILRSVLPLRGRLAFGDLERSMYAMGPIGLLLVGLVAIYLLWPLLSGLVSWIFIFITGI